MFATTRRKLMLGAVVAMGGEQPRGRALKNGQHAERGAAPIDELLHACRQE